MLNKPPAARAGVIIMGKSALAIGFGPGNERTKAGAVGFSDASSEDGTGEIVYGRRASLIRA